MCLWQAAPKNSMFAQQLLEVFGKDRTFLHQVTEMSSELVKEGSGQEAYKDIFLWLTLSSRVGPSPSPALLVKNCILLCDFQISSADVPFFRNITSYLFKERIKSLWIHLAKHRTVYTWWTICLSKVVLNWMNVYTNKPMYTQVTYHR